MEVQQFSKVKNVIKIDFIVKKFINRNSLNDPTFCFPTYVYSSENYD